jgi:hypothetical protein
MFSDDSNGSSLPGTGKCGSGFCTGIESVKVSVNWPILN